MLILIFKRTNLLHIYYIQHQISGNLRKNKNIVITKPHKGNGVVILYLKLSDNNLQEIISDISKFERLNEDPNLKRETSLQHFLCQSLDLSLKTLPCMETSPISCEIYSFFLFRNVATFIKSLYYFVSHDEVILCSLLDICYHYLVFMDSFSGHSKSKLFVKYLVLWKNRISLGYVCLLQFLLSQISTLISLQLTCSCSIEATKHFLFDTSLCDIF